MHLVAERKRVDINFEEEEPNSMNELPVNGSFLNQIADMMQRFAMLKINVWANK
jgi:hypothetical protein